MIEIGLKLISIDDIATIKPNSNNKIPLFFFEEKMDFGKIK